MDPIEKISKNKKLKNQTNEWIMTSALHKYSYNFTWLGLPIIQYPQDIIALQEIIWEIKPDLIIETGIARGGSLIFSASLNSSEQVFNMSGGEQIRDYMHVKEVAYNIVEIALQSKISGIINNCSGMPIKLIDFVKGYLEQRNLNINLNLGYYPYISSEPMAFWGNNQKLKQILCN